MEANCFEKSFQNREVILIYFSYVLLQEKNLVGICLMMFAKESVKNIVQNLNGVIVKTGFIGMLGNKGNVIIRFDINNVSYAVSCCHMTSDLPKNESIVQSIEKINGL